MSIMTIFIVFIFVAAFYLAVKKYGAGAALGAAIGFLFLPFLALLPAIGGTCIAIGFKKTSPTHIALGYYWLWQFVRSSLKAALIREHSTPNAILNIKHSSQEDWHPLA